MVLQIKKKHSHELIDIFCLQRKKNLLLPYYNLQKISTAVMKNFARNNVSNKYPYDYFMYKSTWFFRRFKKLTQILN